MARGIAVVAVLALVGITALVVRDDRGGEERSNPASASRDTASAAEPAPRLVRVPAAVLRGCRSLQPAKRLRVLCPRRLPRARWRVRYRSLERTPSRYLTDLRVDAGAHHVLAGGRRRPFSLELSDGQWPSRVPQAGSQCCSRPGDLGLVGARERDPGVWEPVRMTMLRRVTVRSHPALLLRAASHPEGGIHGGHVAVVWNQGHHGYVFSIHAARTRRITPQDEAIALDAAEAMARTP